jgi:hypothetical protein
MHNIKKIYLYVVSLISLVIMVVGAIMLINLALKTWVFTKADQYAFYPARMQCVEPPAGTSKAEFPECQPGYEEEQRKIEMENRTAQRQRDAAQAIAMILVASPVFYYHWKLARKEV